MHCLVYHVSEQIRQYANLLKFSGQGRINTRMYIYVYIFDYQKKNQCICMMFCVNFIGVEKNNDFAKQHYYCQTNMIRVVK